MLGDLRFASHDVGAVLRGLRSRTSTDPASSTGSHVFRGPDRPQRAVLLAVLALVLTATGTVWGSVAEDTGLEPRNWADTRNDVNIIDTVRCPSSLVRVPDGSINGGDGQITRIDTRLRRATKTVSVPTPLHEGGYLTVIESGGKPLADLVAR